MRDPNSQIRVPLYYEHMNKEDIARDFARIDVNKYVLFFL